MKEIRVGIIGFGFMGKTHTFAYNAIPFYYDNLPYKIKLVGVCNRSIEKAQMAKEYYGFEYATTNEDDILNDDSIDIVNICTINVLHKNAIIKAIKSNKHIYCDKPLCVNYDESAQVLELLENKKIKTQVVLQYRYVPVTLRAKELIEEGKIGNIMSFRGKYLHSGSVDPNKALGWKQDKKYGGGGVLFDLGSHVFDLLYHLLGEFSECLAETDITYKKRPDATGNLVDVSAEDLAIILLRLKNGGLGEVEVSKIATGTNDELKIEIHGDKGAIRFNLMEPNYLEYYDNTLVDEPLGGIKGFVRIECVQRYESPANFPGPKYSPGWIRSHIHSLYSFLESIENDTIPAPSFSEGAYIQYVMEKAYESSKSRAWTQINYK